MCVHINHKYQAYWALIGLAETLHSELMLYGIDVHISFPATIFTPSYVEENKIKPKITLKIEETDGGKTPEAIAASILKGGYVHLCLFELCSLHSSFMLGI